MHTANCVHIIVSALIIVCIMGLTKPLKLLMKIISKL